MIRKIILALGITALSLSAAACNTVKGAGRDIESVGEAGAEAITARANPIEGRKAPAGAIRRALFVRRQNAAAAPRRPA